MNLPNTLTMGRMVLTVLFVAVLSVRWPHAFTAAFLLFLLASVTDFLDGWLARRTNQVTDFGKLMDPLADKILVAAALVLLAVDRLLPAWFVILVLFREFLVTGVRMLALADNRVIAADRWGKLKTVSQIILVCLILGVASFREMGWTRLADAFCFTLPANVAQNFLSHLATPLRSDPAAFTPSFLVLLFFYTALFTTVFSGVGYLRAFLRPPGG